MTPDVNRRQFIQAAGASAIGAVVFVGCGFPRSELEVESPPQMTEDIVSGVDNWYATLCRQCPAGCGIIVRVMEGRAKKIEGNPFYPVNRGKLCARGQAGLQALYNPDRIRQPMRRDRATGKFNPVSWDEALDALAGKLRELRGTPDKVALLTEPLRGHQQLLMTRFSGFYGSSSKLGPKHLTLEPLESAPLRLAVTGVLGQSNQGVLPDYDIANAKCVLSFGADFLSTELSPVRYSTAYGDFRQGGQTRGEWVQVEPRFSLTGANADSWIPINAGTEGTLALSIAYVIVSEGLGDKSAADVLTGGQGAAALNAYRPEQASTVTGVSSERIATIARQFASHRPSLAIGGGPAAAQTNGTSNLFFIMALNFLVGSVGAPGGLVLNPPPLFGVPASAGGVHGGTPLEFWREFTQQQLRAGQVKLVIMHGTNPVYNLPASLKFADALKQVPMMVSFTSVMDETSAMADLILPEHTYLEEWGDDVPDPGPGYQVVGFQQPVVAPLYDTRSFPDVLLDLSRRLGALANLPPQSALPWNSYRDMLRDGAKQLQALNRGSVTDANQDIFWNKTLQYGGWWDTAAKYAGPAPKPNRLPSPADAAKFDGDAAKYPLQLIPFASLSLTDGRGADLPWLQATPDPVTTVAWQTWVEVGQALARDAGLAEGDIVSVESSQGELQAIVYVNPALPPGVVAIPFGQGHTSFGQYAQGRGSNVFSILAPLEDETTGALAWAGTRVRLVKTGRKERVPKFEGAVFPVQVPGDEIIEVTR